MEQGRKIGEKATTRKSRNKQIPQFENVLPYLSFSKCISQDILTLISPLINSKKLVDISNNILLMNKSGFLNMAFSNDKTYRSLPFMANFCEEIINQSTKTEKINFLFQTLTKSISRINNLWEIKIDNDSLIKSKNLILSSSLIAHPRCLKILQINSLPLRDALKEGEDQVVDCVLREVQKQTYISRKIYIFHVTNFSTVHDFGYQYLQIVFSNIIKNDFNFELL